jgi:hypothetical protein
VRRVGRRRGRARQLSCCSVDFADGGCCGSLAQYEGGHCG